MKLGILQIVIKTNRGADDLLHNVLAKHRAQLTNIPPTINEKTIDIAV